jgi:hypothetical protein
MAKKAFLCGLAGAIVDFYKLGQKIFSKALEWKWFFVEFSLESLLLLVQL